jgi:DNA polymerase III, delta subunit
LLLHTSPIVSRVFARLSSPAHLDELSPLLLIGRMGTGKRHYVRALIRQLNCRTSYRPFTTLDPPLYTLGCSCADCGLLERGKAREYQGLSGTETVAELRKVVHDFTDGMSHRFLVLTDLQRHAQDHLDPLLKILEEPPATLKVFATATTTQSIPGPVLSRFRQLRHPDLTSEQLRTIVEATPSLQSLAPQLGAYCFRSVDELLLYVRYDFETKFEAFWGAADIPPLVRGIRDLLQQLSKDREFHPPDVLEFFIEFFVRRIEELCTIHAHTMPELQDLAAALPRAAYQAYETLGSLLHATDAGLLMNRNDQVITLITSLVMLRNILRERWAERA